MAVTFRQGDGDLSRIPLDADHSVSTWQAGRDDTQIKQRHVEDDPDQLLFYELRKLKPRALVKRAEKEKVDSAKLDAAEDADQTIRLILATRAEKVELAAEKKHRLEMSVREDGRDAPWDAYRGVVPVGKKKYHHRHDAHTSRGAEDDGEMTIGSMSKTEISLSARELDHSTMHEGSVEPEKHASAAARQQMDRCYGLSVEGHSSLGEKYDLLLRKLMKDAEMQQGPANGDATFVDPVHGVWRDQVQLKLRKAWVTTSFHGATEKTPTGVGQARLCENYYREHLAEEVDAEAWQIDASRVWFIDDSERVHTELEVVRYDRGSFNGIYRAVEARGPEDGEVHFNMDAEEFPVYRNECGRYLYRTDQRWVFSAQYNPSITPRGVASTRTGNGAVPSGVQSWKGKQPPTFMKMHAESKHIDLTVSELYMKPGFAADPVRWTSNKLQIMKATSNLRYAAKPGPDKVRLDHGNDEEHPEHGARCILAYNPEHAKEELAGGAGDCRGHNIHYVTASAQLAEPLGREFPWFEVETLTDGTPEIGIGLSYLLKEDAAELEMQPGWYDGSVGFHLDTNRLWDGEPDTDQGGVLMGTQSLKKGDRIGCGLVWAPDEDGVQRPIEEADVHEIFFTLNGKELPQRAQLSGFPPGWDPAYGHGLYPTIGMTRATGHGMAVKVMLGTNEPGRDIGMAYAAPVDTVEVPTKHQDCSGFTFMTVRQDKQTHVVLAGLPEGEDGHHLRMTGLREGMILQSVGTGTGSGSGYAVLETEEVAELGEVQRFVGQIACTTEGIPQLLRGCGDGCAHGCVRCWKWQSARQVLEEVERLTASDGGKVLLVFKVRCECPVCLTVPFLFASPRGSASLSSTHNPYHNLTPRDISDKDCLC